MKSPNMKITLKPNVTKELCEAVVRFFELAKLDVCVEWEGNYYFVVTPSVNAGVRNDLGLAYIGLSFVQGFLESCLSWKWTTIASNGSELTKDMLALTRDVDERLKR